MENLSYFKKFTGHLKTITHHRFLVSTMCFRCGMIKQGLLHDLSKYSFIEFWPSVRNFQGDRSPITYEKEQNGYSECWLHHKGRNKHHWEYWIDRKGYGLSVIPMPLNYVLESVIDKIAASKVYKKDSYTIEYPYEFFSKSYEIKVMNSESARQMLYLLDFLRKKGEKETVKYIRSIYSNWKKDKTYRI